MIKEINNKELGKGEIHRLFTLTAEHAYSYLCDRFNTMKELKEWIAKHKSWLDLINKEYGPIYIKEVIEIYTEKNIKIYESKGEET